MIRKGFTLIELLAVIVILAIIALIATPIILGIINDARKESHERSVELYASAVRNAIASYQLTHPNAPTKFSDLNVQYDGAVKCAKEELYADGSFYIVECTVNGDTVEYTYGTQQTTQIEVGKLSSVCKPANDQRYATNPLETGYKYNCKVDPSKEPYTFYVLNSTSESVNLIMDSNINISGEAVKDGVSDKGNVAWLATEDCPNNECGTGNYEEGTYILVGPLTALNHLQEATKNWTNLNKQTINTYMAGPNEIEMPKTYDLYASLPNWNFGMGYMHENMDLTEIEWMGNEPMPENQVLGVTGYWTINAEEYDPIVCAVFSHGEGECSYEPTTDYYGVRPAITLSI